MKLGGRARESGWEREHGNEAAWEGQTENEAGGESTGITFVSLRKYVLSASILNISVLVCLF